MTNDAFTWRGKRVTREEAERALANMEMAAKEAEDMADMLRRRAQHMRSAMACQLPERGKKWR